MSTVAIVLIVVVAIVALLLIGGYVAARRRAEAEADQYRANLAAADNALEAARAADRGWDRSVMEDVARAALNERRPDWSFRTLDLVLVDDRPGVVEDRAQFVASDGDERVGVVLARGDAGWTVEQVG
jgi:type II secretory pathway pseudopilin PulG